MQEIVTKLILELQQNIADNAGTIDYERYEAELLSVLQNLQQCNVSGALPKLAGYLFNGRFYKNLDELRGRTMSEDNKPIEVFFGNDR